MGVSNQGILKWVPGAGLDWKIACGGVIYTFGVDLFLYTTYSCVFDGAVTTIH